MQIIRVLILACVLTIFGASSFASVIVESTFDTDADGWTPFQNYGATVEHSTVGGNPGGHIWVDDKTDEWGYLAAPSKFLATGLYNTELSFDLRHFASGPVSTVLYGIRAALVGNGLSLIIESDLPNTSWTSYSFLINESAGWRIFSDLNQDFSDSAPVPTAAEMQSVLSNLDGLYIATDYTDGFLDGNSLNIDRTYIDNVRLASLYPIYEPLGFFFLIKGLLILLVLNRQPANRYSASQ